MAVTDGKSAACGRQHEPHCCGRCPRSGSRRLRGEDSFGTVSHMLHIFARCGLFVFLTLPLFAHASLPKSSSVPGGVAIVPLAAAGAQKPQARLGDLPVLVTANHHEWYAVVGLPLDMAPGSHDLSVTINGETKALPFEVKPKQYPEQHLVLKDKSKVELSPEDQARAQREMAELQELKRHWRDAEDTDLAFMMPVKGRLASRFGLRRFFNGEPRLPHAGLDVAVPAGTPIKASAHGIVLAVGEYFFNGKTVFIDHGNGLITMYCHLSQIDVQAGEVIRKGQVLGLSGMTGRATGPHLHWSVILNGAMVDPQLFVRAKRTR